MTAAGRSAHARGGHDRGALAIVLHTHMPYVEGFDTWPFGEEWLWEAMVGCYLPLLELLDTGAPLTLSLTPVLCDQLEAPGVADRFARFVGETRRLTYSEDVAGLRAADAEALALELERSWAADYEWALERFAARGGDLLAALAPYAQWTSSATHAVLPLLASDAGVRLQLGTGLASHRRRFGGWRGGFWQPECAHAPWLEPLLAEAGVRSTCVELTARFGLGAREHLQPLQGDSGVALVPVDRESMSLVWSERGYPAAGVYRDYHRHTTRHHKPWANDGSAYDPELALARAREDGADFVARTIARLRDSGSGLPGGGLAVCALDTELLGHWWYEGVAWLTEVVEECARQGLRLTRLDDALEALEPARIEGGEEWSPSSWGQDGDLSTWSCPAVAEMAFAARRAELEVLAARERAGAPAARGLLALQASDWPFLVSRDLAVDYAGRRFEAHRQALAQMLRAGAQAEAVGLRNISPQADPALLRAP